jgi:probable HAF family extracellular repeat protein
VAINNRGQIVGRADTADKDTRGFSIAHAFLWEGGTMRDLGDWSPVAINERGQIVGES